MNTSSWSQRFDPLERAAIDHIDEVTNSAQWLLYGVSGLMALLLFIASGYRSHQGDVVGAIFSACGAVVVAVAPILADHFIIGG